MATISQKAGALDIEIEEGSTFDKTLTWRDENAALVNLTGYTAKMELRRKKTDAAAALTLTGGAGLTLGGVNGTIQIVITKAQNILGAESFFYDLELTDSGDVTTRLVEGVVNSIAEATK